MNIFNEIQNNLKESFVKPNKVLTEDVNTTSDDVMVYMNTWKNYNEYGADLEMYGIKDGWMTPEQGLEFCKKYAEDEPFINDVDNCPIEVSEYDNAPAKLKELIRYNEFEDKTLLKNAMEKIDIVYQLRGEYFKDFSKNDLINFLKENKPNNDALIHGDFSLTNILVNNEKYYYIDLGNVSISTKYFDIYILKKSLKLHHLEEEWEEFLRGYNIDDYNEIYMRWMELIELSYN